MEKRDLIGTRQHGGDDEGRATAGRSDGPCVGMGLPSRGCVEENGEEADQPNPTRAGRAEGQRFASPPRPPSLSCFFLTFLWGHRDKQGRASGKKEGESGQEEQEGGRGAAVLDLTTAPPPSFHLLYPGPQIIVYFHR